MTPVGELGQSAASTSHDGGSDGTFPLSAADDAQDEHQHQDEYQHQSMPKWRQWLFAWLQRHEVEESTSLGIPAEFTVIVDTDVDIP